MDWPHAPLHRFGEAGIYFITASTLHKEHIFRTADAKDSLQERLFKLSRAFKCWLQAWALFSNHYHLVIASDYGNEVRRMLRSLHTRSAIEVNQRDGTTGRKVWYQFWDTQLTHQSSWLARLKYTHENAVHHGIVADARNYRWCSASWFASSASTAFVETVRRMKTDRIRVYDEFGRQP